MNLPYGLYLTAAPWKLSAQCTNVEFGTYGRECGKPASWIGTRQSRNDPTEKFSACFCDGCKEQGREAKSMTEWQHLSTLTFKQVQK